MSDGRFVGYYWQICALLGEKVHLLDTGHPDYELSEDIDAEYVGNFWATIVFKDGSHLVVRFTLRSDGDIEEFDYSYQYIDPQGKRIFRYDDAPHHPEVTTHPHHLHKGPEPTGRAEDRVYPLDIPKVAFATVLAKIERQYLKA